MPYQIPSMTNSPYRPSNGTEGHAFQERFCRRCVHDQEYGDPCRILMRSMLFGIEDDQYPSEWTHDEEGRPVCTAHDPCEYSPLDVPDDHTAAIDVSNDNGQAT